MPLTRYFAEIKEQVDVELDRLVPDETTRPAALIKAMRHSLFAGGKRLRPILAVAAAEAVDGSREAVMPFAAAVEIIHTYTLIHDDLPALDDDDTRRGAATCHVKFGEATAILAGDALLTLAFEVMTDSKNFPGAEAAMLLDVARETAEAIGSTGTIGGQVVDLEMEGKEADMAALEYIHTHKTGKLIVASIRGGARLGGAEEDRLEALTVYGKNVGLAFQVVDDILDVEGDAEKLGKAAGADAKKKKATYPSLMGVEESRKLAARLIDRAIAALDMLGDSGEKLSDLARYVIARAF
ncbi:MAG: polyprenyl synthetase family protein [Candidatus Nitrospinota bacterium M3_3B_026]